MTRASEAEKSATVPEYKSPSVEEIKKRNVNQNDVNATKIKSNIQF